MTGLRLVAVSGVHVMTWSLLVIAGAMVLFVACTAIGRVLRLRRIARRTILRDELRPFVVAVLAEPDGPPAIPSALGGRSEALFEVLALDYLTKVRGESREALVRVLVERGTIGQAERRLARPGGVGRAAAAELLGRCGLPRSARPLTGLLTHRSGDVRVVGVRALGRLGLPDAVQPLMATLDARRPVPPAHVAQALVRIGTIGVPALRLALTTGGEPQRAVAAEALGLLRAVEAVPELIGALRDEALGVRERAASALGRIGDPRALRPLLAAVPSGTDMDLVVAHALGDMCDPVAVPTLRALLGVTSATTSAPRRRHHWRDAGRSESPSCGTSPRAMTRAPPNRRGRRWREQRSVVSRSRTRPPTDRSQ